VPVHKDICPVFPLRLLLNLIDYNLSDLTGGFRESGLLELHLGRNGTSMNIGTGGVNVSYSNLAASLRGAQVWNVNNRINNFIKKEETFDAAIALRAQYGYGDDVQKGRLWDILKGDTKIIADTEGDFFAQTTIVDGQRVINLSGYKLGMNMEEQMFFAMVLGHEAYRDGIVTNDNDIETRKANLVHTEMAIRMLNDGHSLPLNENLIRDLVAYSLGEDFFNAYSDSFYDSSADYWKLMRDGTLVNDNKGWLVYENGKPILNEKDEWIGAGGIETGLLNILFGGTHGVGYDKYSDEQIRLAQMLMIGAGMKYTEDKDGNIRSRKWIGNEIGQSLDMQQIMQSVGATVAAPVFARYYEENAHSFMAWILRKNIDFSSNNIITDSAINRFCSELIPAVYNYYNTMRSFLNNSENFQVTAKHGATDPRFIYKNYEKDAHFGTDFGNGKSGGSIYLGIPGVVINTQAEEAPGKGNGNWMVAEYGYMFERTFIGSGIFGEYMHMEAKPNFNIGSYLNSTQIIGTVGNTGNSTGPHLHYTIYTLENYPISQSTLKLLLNNNYSKTVVSKEAAYFYGTYKAAAKKVTYDIENFLRGL